MSAGCRCQRCAKDFTGQAWRIACDRCGDRVVRASREPALFHAAPRRAFLAGWTPGSAARNPALAKRRQAAADRGRLAPALETVA